MNRWMDEKTDVLVDRRVVNFLTGSRNSTTQVNGTSIQRTSIHYLQTPHPLSLPVHQHSASSTHVVEVRYVIQHRTFLLIFAVITLLIVFNHTVTVAQVAEGVVTEINDRLITINEHHRIN